MLSFWDPKALSLVVLSLQNTALVLTMRISRTRENVPMYLASVAVMTDELMKLIVCVIMLLLAYRSSAASAGNYHLVESGERRRGGPSVQGLVDFWKTEVFQSPFEFFKMVIPAFLYAIQKNLLYTAISNLEAAVFQVTYQGKIMTTALFSVLLLKKQLTRRQVIALFILVGGVALVQLSTLDPSKTTSSSGAQSNFILGFVAVLCACCTSGFAAIYFEWILKKTPPQEMRPYSLWVRNFQLATFAVIGSALAVWSKDSEAVSNSGLYQGFNALVWTVVSLEAFGGIVVALVVKYADNILKNFSTAVSIVTSTVVSAIFLGFSITPSFVIGAMCVMASLGIYSSNPNAALFTRLRDKSEDAVDIEINSMSRTTDDRKMYDTSIQRQRQQTPESEKAEI